MDFNIIGKSTGEAAKYAPYVVELYEKHNGETVPIEDVLNRLSKDAALLNGNKNSHKILLCPKTDPYPADYEGEITTRQAVKILDENGLDYVICTENAMRAVSDFEQLKHPKNITLIIKIESIKPDENYENQINENFENLLYNAIDTASKKGVRTGIQFGPGSDPMLSLQLVYGLYLEHGLYSVVDMWEVGDLTYEPATIVRSTWEKFKEDAKDKGFFKTLGQPKSLSKYDINTIPGDPRLLLIAPHGVATKPQDDINTDKLTLKIAKKLKCSAIVNDVISRLYLDFNKVDEADKHDKFIPDIKEVLKLPGPTLVVWIHGIGAENLKNEIKALGVENNLQCLIGYGQPEKNTANQKTVEKLIKVFEDNSIIAHPARNGSGYCGNIDSYMNQWFRSNGYKLDDVESVQLEFKEKGIRSNEDLEAASHNITKALSELVGLEYHVEQKPIDLPVESEKVDMKLVDDAYRQLETIFSNHYENAMFEAGQYIVQTFYNGDIELARDNKPAKEASFRKLEDRLKTKTPNAPSKSWLNYSVQLFVATNEIMEKESNTTVQTYGQLLVSHKTLLFPIRNRDTKIQLIQETVQNNYTVVQLKDRIAELKAADKSKTENRKSLLQVINNPDLLFSDRYENDREEKSLSELNVTKLEKIYKKTESKLSDIEHEVEEIELKLTTHREYARNYKKLLESVERAKEIRLKNPGINRYLLISALQKSIRWCEVNESRYFAREYMNMGYPGGVFKRLILIAAEDVGLEDPSLVEYERRYSDSFESLIKEREIKKSDAYKFPDLCEIVDRAVIAAAISYKSRLLPQLSFATLFNIYKNEDFSKNLSEYLDRFVEALGKRDEEQALYNAYVAGIFLNSMDKILALIQKHSGIRNKDLIQKWVEEYQRNNELLMLAGSIVLLCRDLDYPHGEYKDAISQHLSSPIKKAEIPDRAYDMHTSVGPKKGRGLEHFFDVAATVKNERFPNNWEQAGRTAYLSADKKGLAKAVEIIEAIKENYEKSKKSQKREGIYSSASV